jgi:hypothetical protein
MYYSIPLRANIFLTHRAYTSWPHRTNTSWLHRASQLKLTTEPTQVDHICRANTTWPHRANANWPHRANTSWPHKRANTSWPNWVNTILLTYSRVNTSWSHRATTSGPHTVEPIHADHIEPTVNILPLFSPTVIMQGMTCQFSSGLLSKIRNKNDVHLGWYS